MAQNIKLKRSSVAGKVPTTSQLEAGELAINTVDGKLYFERDDSTIQSIVTTNALITGSLNINGPITGSDVTIEQWGSVSASLATISSQSAVIPTLDQVTDQGNTTTNNITVGSITSVVNGPLGFPALFKTGNGQTNFVIESSGSGGTNPGEVVLRFRDYSGIASIDGTITYGGGGGDIFVIENHQGAKLQFQGPLDDQQLWLNTGGGTGSILWGDVGGVFIQKVGTSDTRFFGTASYADRALSASFATTASYVATASYIPTLNQVTDQGSTTTNSITAASFTGSLLGTATTASYATFAASAGSATSATSAFYAHNISISATTATNTATSVVLVANQEAGNQSPFIDSGLLYNHHSSIQDYYIMQT